MAEGIMVIGGSSSGKSQYAEELTGALEIKLGFPVYYLATARVIDEEFEIRVERHRKRRPTSWKTIEEPIDLAGVLHGISPGPVILLVDGIGTWIANLLIENPEGQEKWDAESQTRCLNRVYDFIESWQAVDGAIIMVADEVGWDLPPEYELGRRFVDLNGQTNQMLARAAEEVNFVASGVPMRLKGGIN